jgi:hypothetical protein
MILLPSIWLQMRGIAERADCKAQGAELALKDAMVAAIRVEQVESALAQVSSRVWGYDFRSFVMGIPVHVWVSINTCMAIFACTCRTVNVTSTKSDQFVSSPHAHVCCDACRFIMHAG